MKRLILIVLTFVFVKVNAQMTIPNRNPIIKDQFTADLAALVDNGTVYLYTGHDVASEK